MPRYFKEDRTRYLIRDKFESVVHVTVKIILLNLRRGFAAANKDISGTHLP